MSVTSRPALQLYDGKVMHARLKPVGHRFTYRVASILIDIDRLSDAAKASPLFSVNRFNILAFRERDHGPRDGSPLRAHVDQLLREAGLQRPARIELLCYPSVLGYTFNPISVYFCYDTSGTITALIYQVHNTFGESHSYVEPVRSGQLNEAGIRQVRRKALYVSPFLEADMTYHFRILPPGKEVALRILETDAKGPILAATFHDNARPATSSVMVRAVLSSLGIPWKVISAIHFEALKLWLKGLKLQDGTGFPPAAGLDKEAKPQNGFVANGR